MHQSHRGKREVPQHQRNTGCKQTLPDLKNMLEITKQHMQLKEEVKAQDTRITKLEVLVQQMNETMQTKDEQIEDMKTKQVSLQAKIMDKDEVQTIAQRIFKNTDFPELTTVRSNQEKQLEKMEAIEKTQHEDREEIKKRQATVDNLIVYGIPEGTDIDQSEQMKLDYNNLNELYKNRVKISSTDLLQVSRLGQVKENQIRPIKITFDHQQKRGAMQ